MCCCSLKPPEFRQHADWCRQIWWDRAATAWENYEPEGLNAMHLRALAPYLKSQALVIGGGQGFVSEILFELGFLSQAVDWSNRMIQRAWQRRQLRIKKANANSLPFDSNFFATSIITTGVLSGSHTNSELSDYLYEAARVVQPHGTVVVSILKSNVNTQVTFDAPIDLAVPTPFLSSSRIIKNAPSTLTLYHEFEISQVSLLLFQKHLSQDSKRKHS